VKNNEKKKLLFTPGPLNIPFRVREAMLQEMGSRTKDFTKLISEVENRLALMTHPTTHEVIVSSGSATEMLERVMSNFIQASETVLVIENGFYGRRLANLVERLGYQSIVVSVEPFDTLTEEKILAAIPNQSFDWVVMVHCETSTGILNPVSEVLRGFYLRGCKVMLDCVSSFPVIEIPWDLVTVAVTTSGKCLQGPPGIPIAVVHSDLLKQGIGNTVSLTCDLFLHWQNVRTKGQWRYTPPIPLLLGLHEALKIFDERGGPNDLGRNLQNLTSELIRLLAPLGLQLLNDPSHSMPGILTFKIPDFVEWEKIVEYLDEHGIVIYPGIVESIPSFRICLFGDLGLGDLSVLNLRMTEAFEKFSKSRAILGEGEWDSRSLS
jgi:2-aminoethylphosphonate-pyruvate transaminase